MDEFTATNEKENLREKAGFFAWRPAAWLRVSGADSFSFLQGQFTNELRGLEAAGAVYGLWLNHKGRVLADSFVMRGRGADEFWVGSYFSTAAVIRERLEAFIIADDVVVEDVTAQWAGVAVLGDGEAAEAIAAVRAISEESGGFVFRGRRTSGPSWECVVPLERAAEIRMKLAAQMRELSGEEMERRRVRAGIPAVPQDIGPGELANEGGLDAVAISYTKGCYLGQEVMARLKSMGQVRRRLVRVKGVGACPTPPAELFQGERRIGELRSAVSEEGGSGFVGLALVSLLNMQAGLPAAFSANGAGVIEILDTPVR